MYIHQLCKSSNYITSVLLQVFMKETVIVIDMSLIYAIRIKVTIMGKLKKIKKHIKKRGVC